MLRPDPRDAEGKRLLPPPEWGEIKNRRSRRLRKSKDLRLLAHLGTASLRTDGLPAFAETLTVASQWLETYWAETYPLVDEDAILRRNALNCFADPMAVVDGLRRLPLVSSRQHGRFSLRDIEIATGQHAAGRRRCPPGRSAINAAFAEMPLDELTALRAERRRRVGGAEKHRRDDARRGGPRGGAELRSAVGAARRR